MADKIQCPSCKEDIKENLENCPHCGGELKIQCWEIKTSDGQSDVYEGKKGFDEIQAKLNSGEIAHSDQCRKYTKTLEQVVNGQRLYRTGSVLPWDDVKYYIDNGFDLKQGPGAKKSGSNSYAVNTFLTLWVLSSVGISAGYLIVDGGANPIMAVIISAIALLLTCTLIGLPLISFGVSFLYDIPAMGLALSCLGALLLGGLGSMIVGWPLGYMIGALFGEQKTTAKSSSTPIRPKIDRTNEKKALKEKPAQVPSVAPKGAEPRNNLDGKQCKIVLTGIQTGHDPEVVKQQFVRLTKSSPEQIEKIFARVPVTIKSNLTHEKAVQFLSHIQRAGGEARIAR